MNVSKLSTTFANELLRSPSLPALVRLNSWRLSEAYQGLTSCLKRCQIEYLPCDTAPFLLVKLAPHARTWEEEEAVIESIRQAGVLVAGGRRFHMPEKGWARICFAVEPIVLKEAVARIEGEIRGAKNLMAEHAA